MDIFLLVIVLVAGVATGISLLTIRGRRVAAPVDQTQQIVELVLALAGEKLADHAAAVDQQAHLRGVTIDQQVATMTSELTRVGDLVTTLQRDRALQHGEITARLTETARQSHDLGETTQSLRQALASPKSRGQWGERMADDVLRAAGLVEGVNYRRQKAVPGGSIPDVTFLLPGDRVLHMDVKFPIDNYVRSIEAESPAEADVATASFLRDVRQRIKEVTTRAYIDPETTLDEVLLFIPNESVYSFIHQHDPGMIDKALAQRVVLCSPFTLFAVLAVIRQSTDQHQIARTGDEILECLTGFTTQWSNFSDQLDMVAKRFDSAQKAFDDLAGTRRRALQRKVDAVDELRTRRGLPDRIEPATESDDLKSNTAHAVLKSVGTA
ncbi:MAG: DNA recombination protein RmuC [Actinomycetes bacterium]